MAPVSIGPSNTAEPLVSPQKHQGFSGSHRARVKGGLRARTGGAPWRGASPAGVTGEDGGQAAAQPAVAVLGRGAVMRRDTV